jgi:hypothetical protein
MTGVEEESSSKEDDVIITITPAKRLRFLLVCCCYRESRKNLSLYDILPIPLIDRPFLVIRFTCPQYCDLSS